MTPPLSAVELVQRVLHLERRQQYQNRAAVGGLERFVANQALRPDAPPQVALASQTLAGYGRLTPGERASVLVKAMDVVAGRSDLPSMAGETSPAEIVTRGATSPPKVEPPARKRATASRPMPGLDAPVSAIPGVRKPMPELLEKLGVRTVRDLLFYFPRTHYDFSDASSISRLRYGEPSTVIGTVDHVRTNRRGPNAAITTAAVSDATGTVAVRWFNQPFMEKQLPVGTRVAISGVPETYNGFTVFTPKEYEVIESEDLVHTGRWVPVYGLTKGLYQRALRKVVRRVVDHYAEDVRDPVSPSLRAENGLYALATAVREYHFPTDEASRDRAQQRLAFDELLLILIGLLRRKARWQQEIPEVALGVDRDLECRFRESLRFALTGAQDRVLREIYADLGRPMPMTRLLQGDVGAGKTVVAAAALLQVVRSGKQGVLMAPTELLAEQHFRTLQSLLEPFEVRTQLLIGSVKSRARRAAYEAAASGGADVLVGTQALIQEGLAFAALGLAVTDEQHRFGVEQRALLRQKGLHPHTLAMTATPIPRTLAMTIYGDLDVSVLDEMPPGRLPVLTRWVQRPGDAYRVIREQVSEGRQAFVVCPVIEESADSDMRSAMAEYRELETVVFSDLRVGLLHGRMKPTEKERALAAFRAGEFDVLVATSVVEVGIDIPNATVMVIRDAHRFGLAQLHQFRGRVGRGGDQAFCVLLSDTRSEEAIERLEALTACQDGFELAEADLRLRGPGEFWGTRQSGLPELRVATLGDIATISMARQAALAILRDDPDLDLPENRVLAERVRTFWKEEADLS